MRLKGGHCLPDPDPPLRSLRSAKLLHAQKQRLEQQEASTSPHRSDLTLKQRSNTSRPLQETSVDKRHSKIGNNRSVGGPLRRSQVRNAKKREVTGARCEPCLGSPSWKRNGRGSLTRNAVSKVQATYRRVCSSEESSTSSNSSDTCSSPRKPLTTDCAVPCESGSESLKFESESQLECLPLDLIVRIVCCLRHDELQPVSLVCKRLRKATSIARHYHFNFKTPERRRRDKVGNHGFVFQCENEEVPPPTPRAPKHIAKRSQLRSFDIAPPLFPDLGCLFSVEAQKTCRLPIRRSTAPHRALFYEDELCQAVAQNTISF